MIVSKKKEYVYISVMKCGTHSMYHILQKDYKGLHYPRGFNPSGTLDFVPDEEFYGEIPDFKSKAEHQLAVAEMLDELCHRCGLTKNQLGDNICYDEHCGLKEWNYESSNQ